jgi:hypothetical protein
VTPSTVLIAARSFETSVRANTRNALLASYQFAKRRNWEFNLASIDPDYPKSTSIGFDPTYMQQLFEYGYRRGRSGKLWQSTPSDLSLPAPPRVAGR